MKRFLFFAVGFLTIMATAYAETTSQLYTRLAGKKFVVRTGDPVGEKILYWQHPPADEKYFSEDRLKGEHVRGTADVNQASYFTIIKKENDIFIQATQKVDGEQDRKLQQWDAAKSSDRAKNRVVFHNKNTKSHEAWRLVDGKHLQNPHSKWYLYFREKNGKFNLETIKDKNDATPFEFITKEDLTKLLESESEKKDIVLGELGYEVKISDEEKERISQASDKTSMILKKRLGKPVVVVIKDQEKNKVGFLTHGIGSAPSLEDYDQQDNKKTLSSNSFIDSSLYLIAQPCHVNEAAQFMLIPGEQEEFFIEACLPLKKDDKKRRALQHEKAGEDKKYRSALFASTDRKSDESWKITSEGFIQNNTSKWYLALDYDNRLIADPNKENAVEVAFKLLENMKKKFPQITPSYKDDRELFKEAGPNRDITHVFQVWDNDGRDLGYAIAMKEFGSTSKTTSMWSYGNKLSKASQFSFAHGEANSVLPISGLVRFQGKSMELFVDGLITNSAREHYASLGDRMSIDRTTNMKRALHFEALTYEKARERELEKKKAVDAWINKSKKD